MDERLYKLYYPNGIQDNIEELAQDNLVLDNTMVEYINGNHPVTINLMSGCR